MQPQERRTGTAAVTLNEESVVVEAVQLLEGQMALAGGSLASRRTGKRAPVVAADGFKFIAPVDVGDELSVWAEVASEGRTSMTIATQAWKRDRHGEAVALVAEGRFVFVGVGGLRGAGA